MTKKEVKMDQGGFVRLVDSMPSQGCTLDYAIVQAARVSYSSTSSKTSDEGLIRYLMRHWHTSPFEMIEFKFHMKMPIFVARQHIRHRTASVNELSGRYSIMSDEYYVPKKICKQSTDNKQGSTDEPIRDQEVFVKEINDSNAILTELYQDLIKEGCSRELARTVLPVSNYTEMYWKIDLHNLLHYLQLRLHPTAQKEIREYAEEILRIIEPLVPLTIKAFMDYRLDAITLSGPEVRALSNYYPPACITNKTERLEFVEKLKTLGLYKGDDS